MTDPVGGAAAGPLSDRASTGTEAGTHAQGFTKTPDTGRWSVASAAHSAHSGHSVADTSPSVAMFGNEWINISKS